MKNKVRFIFAILGVNLYRDRFGYCEVHTNFRVNEADCRKKGLSWVRNDLNFDSIPDALISLFVIATFDNWIYILDLARNSDLSSKGPSPGNNSYSSYLYIYSFILISVLFLVNLFLGIMFVKFQLAEKAGGKYQDHLSENQEKWVQMQSRILSIEPYNSNIANIKGIRKTLVNIMTSKQYSFLISIFPLVVFLILMTENHDLLRSEALSKKNAFVILISVFSVIFNLEILLKLFAFSVKGYFGYNWNIMEFIIGIGYLILTIVEFLRDDDSHLDKSIKTLRLLRILPIFRLFHRFRFLRKMRKAITFKMPTILSILSLLGLFLLVYALLAVYFFHDVDIDAAKALDANLNFQNVFSAMMTLFICATGENWSLTLIDVIKYSPLCGTQSYLCGTCTPPFFLSLYSRQTSLFSSSSRS